MKFPTWKRETHDREFREDIFRAVNFELDEDGHLICPSNQKLYKQKETYISEKVDHRAVEYYTCEDCEG